MGPGSEAGTTAEDVLRDRFRLEISQIFRSRCNPRQQQMFARPRARRVVESANVTSRRGHNKKLWMLAILGRRHGCVERARANPPVDDGRANWRGVSESAHVERLS